MLNAKWYLVCDVYKRIATDLIQIPAVWGQATGLGEQSDDNLETFYEWSPHRNISFLQIDRARELGISEDSITDVLALTRPALLAWVRSMRDPLLQGSDAVTVTDRWNSYNVVSQNNIKVYRQALRDLTEGDLLHLEWPMIPPELQFLRANDYSHIERPSVDFANTLSAPFPALTLEQRRANVWLLIKAERDQRKAGGVAVTVDNVVYWFWTDDPSRNQYTILDGFAQRNNMADDTVIDNWKTMSGEFVPFTVKLLRQVMDVGIVNEMQLFAVAEQHRTNAMVFDVPENYDYRTGWPMSHQEYAKQQIAQGNLEYAKGSEA